MKNHFKVTVIAVIAISSLLTSFPILGLSFPNPKVTLSHKFSLEHDLLIQQLSTGISKYHSIRQSEVFFEQARLQINAWSYYGIIAQYLGESGSEAAIPTLIKCITDPLPEGLRSDLDFYLVTKSRASTWEEWDRLAQDEIKTFRVTCAIALAHIGKPSAAPEVAAFAEELGAAIRVQIRDKDSDFPDIEPLAKVCRAATALGDRSAVRHLMSLLDFLPDERVPGRSQELNKYLKLCTGQEFKSTAHFDRSTYEEEYGDWTSWWAKNKTTFDINSASILFGTWSIDAWVMNGRYRNREFPDRKLILPRDNLVEAFRSGTFLVLHRDMEEFHREIPAYVWLLSRGPRFMGSFRAIANDTSEWPEIRALAADFYSRFGGEGALELLSHLSTAPRPFNRSRDSDFDLFLYIHRILQSDFPDQLNSVSKEWLHHNTRHALYGLENLLRNQNNDAYLVENFHSFPDSAKSRVLWHLYRTNNPHKIDILLDVVNGDNLSVAVQITSWIGTLNLYESLPSEAQEALTQWERDPEYLLHPSIRQSMDAEAMSKVLAGTGPASAYANYWEMRDTIDEVQQLNNGAFTGAYPPEYDKALVEAWENIVRNVDVYRERRH